MPHAQCGLNHIVHSLPLDYIFLFQTIYIHELQLHANTWFLMDAPHG